MQSPHIQFEDDGIQRIATGLQRVTTESGGVFGLRERTNTGIGSLAPSIKRSQTKESVLSSDLEDGEAKTAQNFRGWKLVYLSYQSIGVIYGDIGTSPLYVYSSTFTKNPSKDDLLGVLSLIIWSLILMVSVKYVLIVLRADDEGEGGTFALYSLLSRYANIVRRDPLSESKIKIRRALTYELDLPAQKTRNFLETSRFMKWLLRAIGVLGVSLVMSDGVLTPAQSVLGAIQGLEVVTPNISQSTIIGVSCAIIILLFLIQPFGTTTLANGFGPVVIVWLLFNLTFGIYNLAVHDWTVLKAFSPYFAGSYLARNHTEGWKSLGGILLAFTGCEALFADLGAFSRQAIQLSWLTFAFPCLIISYIGQAAYISEKPDAWSNPFFRTVPPGMLYPSLIAAILASVVASQAVITAVFQLISQITTLSYFPQIKIVHTSKVYFGQIYVPFANWLLMVGTVVITAVFSNTTRLGHAYGVCVILVTFLTTNLVGLVALIVWQYPSAVVIPIWLVFALFDALFLSSALTKVPDGAWFTLALAVVLSSVFMLWHYGKEHQWSAEAADRIQANSMLVVEKPSTDPDEHSLKLTPAYGGHRISRIDGIGIYFDKSGNATTIPSVFVNFLQKFHAASEIAIFFHLRPLSIPSIPPESRFVVSRCFVSSATFRDAVPNCFRVMIKYGYTDQVMTSDLAQLLYDQVREFLIKEATPQLCRDSTAVFREAQVDSNGRSLVGSQPLETIEEKVATTTTSDHLSAPTDTSSRANSINTAQSHLASLSRTLAALERAFRSQTVYVVGKGLMRVRVPPRYSLKKQQRTGTLIECVKGVTRYYVLSMFLWMRNSTKSKIERLQVGVDGERLVEMGVVKII